MAAIKVGPISSGSYIYRIGNRMSESRYANSASAWADARRPQKVNVNGNLEPDVDEEPIDLWPTEKGWATDLSNVGDKKPWTLEDSIRDMERVAENHRLGLYPEDH